MRKSESIDQLAAALAIAQGRITGARKDSANPFFNSNYADLASVWEACRSPLSENGLCVIQTMDIDLAGKTHLNTVLAHKSGQWIESVIVLNPTKQDAQGWGSVITYMRRYALAAIVGVAQVDDDGNAASQPHKAPQQSVAKKQQELPKQQNNGKGVPSASKETSPNTPPKPSEPRASSSPSRAPEPQPTFTKRSGGYNDFIPIDGEYKGIRLGDVPVGVLRDYRKRLEDHFKQQGTVPNQKALDVLSAITGIIDQEKAAKEFFEKDKVSEETKV